MSLEQLEPEIMGADTHGLPRGQTWDKGSKGGSTLSVGHHPQEGGTEGGRWGPGVVTGSKAPWPLACETHPWGGTLRVELRALDSGERPCVTDG